MTGWGEYDLLGPSAFMTAGMRGRVANLFRGFGYSGADLNPALTRRAGATALAHFLATASPRYVTLRLIQRPTR
jgi:hygromycin-B 7''-O-kinase